MKYLFFIITMLSFFFVVPEVHAQVSCPVPGGKILTNSFQVNPQGGHCGSGYGFGCYEKCPTTSRRAKAIDIITDGKDVVLPMINGQTVNWTLLIKGYTVLGGEGGGLGHTFEAKVGSDTWHLDMLHLTQTPINQGESRPSGTAVGRSVAKHVHATIGKGIPGIPRAATDSDCDPGWMASDFMCDPNSQPPQSGTGTGVGNTSGGQSTGGSASTKFCTKVGTPTDPNPCPPSSGGGTGPTGSFPYYCQKDTQWQNSSWQCTLAGNGCGPTTLAMIFSYYGDPITPAAQYEEVQKGNFDCGQGTYLPSMLNGNWFKNKGYEVSANLGDGAFNAEEAKKYIDAGWIIIGSTNAYNGTGYSHIFAITDVDPAAGTFTMRDPANCGSDGVERTENIVQPIRGGQFVPSWYYARAVRKIGYTPIKKDVGTVSAEGKAFPVSGWTTGVKLHWDEDKGGSDFPADKPANPNQWEGTAVVAMEDSVVEEVNGPEYKGPGGNYVQLKGKSGLSYYYAHLKERTVEQGKEVKAGERIGSIGKTGNAEFAHLHLGIGPSISYGAGAKGGVGNYNAVGLLCSLLNKPINERGDCR